MKKYFIILNEEQKGPFSINDLSGFEIKQNTPIWFEGLVEWSTVDKISELNHLFIKEIAPPVYTNLSGIKENISPPNFVNKNLINNIEANKKNNINRNLIIGGFLLLILFFTIYKIGAVEDNKVQNNIKNNTSKTYSDIDSTSVPVDQNSEAYSEVQNANNTLTEKNRNYRNNFADYITISNNSYEYREIGGIFNLKMILTNNTDYAINGAIVSVNYIQENGKLYKSESVSFEDIPAHSSQTQYAPDSDRGTSVDYYIENVVSTEMNFNFPHGKGNSEDPYFYKYN